MANDKPKVEVTKNGPYMVSGNVPLAKGIMLTDNSGIPTKWQEGDVLPTEDVYFLCRCGNSKHKPFCDDTHLSILFDGAETAGNKKFSEQAEIIDGPGLVLNDARAYCASARFCTRAGGIRNLIAKSDNPEFQELAIQESLNCSSGRLVVTDKKTGLPVERFSEPSITVAEDPGKKVSGPLYLKGGIEVVSSDGKKYETRNRVTLCRCGRSGNKPFCDGSHIKAGFNDGDKSINDRASEMAKQEVLSSLKKHLQTAITLEQSTHAPYLYAYWSIQGDSDHARHVKKFILSVIQEEMLHLAMACNILNAIGGSPVLNDPNILPSYPCALPGHSKTNNAFIVHLNKCCPESISNFMQIELPDEQAVTTPHSDGWCTIGEFYDEIEALIRHNVIDDSDFSFGKQLDGSFNPAKGNLYTVTSRQEALDALEEIVDQGEGHSGKLYDKDHELTHYWKFRAIHDLMQHEIWNYQEDVVDACIDPDEKYFSTEAKQLNRNFNMLYSELLDAMQAAFTSTAPSLDEAIQIMLSLQEPATQLMNIPLAGKKGNAAPTFSYIPLNERRDKKI